MAKYKSIVPDTSAIINGVLSRDIENKKISVSTIIIHNAIIAELENQANQNREVGFLGLDELKKLSELEKQNLFQLKFEGSRPKPIEIKHAKKGEIDAIIRQSAWDHDSALLTSDKVQAEVAEAMGMNVLFHEYILPEREWSFVKLFKPNFMSVHIREKEQMFAKAGSPGNWKFVKINKRAATAESIEKLAEEIVEIAKSDSESFLEIERKGSIIAQLKNYRIVITKPPFSDGWEITIVRPVKKLSIKEYGLDPKLLHRIEEKAEGILIAGAPGNGKTTFAQAVAINYASKNKIVKTLEAPRDLYLPSNITQYAISKGTPQELHDIMLLTRPDYAIFDEMRNTNDFRLYSDLRLAGVGMVGVIHATAPIEAMQRFIGRIELGMIPSIIDTIIFIEKGLISQVLSLKITVKVPSGMTEADLARPVIDITDFITNELKYEAYTYGEQTVIIPVRKQKKSKTTLILERAIKEHLGKMLNIPLEVEELAPNKYALFVSEEHIPQVLGTKGSRIKSIEEDLGIGIDVRPLVEEERYIPSNLKYNLRESKKYLVFQLSKPRKLADLYINGERISSLPVSRKNEIKIFKKTKIGKKILAALTSNAKLEFS